MRIGIITCWTSTDNYGQKLQCFALQMALRNMGHDPYLIKYNPISSDETIIKKMSKALKSPSIFFKYIPFTKSYVNFKEEIRLRKINNVLNEQRKFEIFQKQYISSDELVYSSYNELKANPPKADVFITGSDQVWHTSFYDESINGWFLQFGAKDCKRISYAASIGRKLKKGELFILKKLLKTFDAISVREESAKEICQNQGLKVSLCIDPTLLLSINEYPVADSKRTLNDNFVFLYIINIKNQEELYWPKIKEYIYSNNLTCKCVTSSGYYQARTIVNECDNLLATIPEWLFYIGHSHSVITSSFHGVVFSILMHRPFIYIGLKGKYKQANCRIEQLLNDLNLKERIFQPDQDLNIQMKKNINWNYIDNKLSHLRELSLNFLHKSLTTL